MYFIPDPIEISFDTVNFGCETSLRVNMNNIAIITDTINLRLLTFSNLNNNHRSIYFIPKVEIITSGVIEAVGIAYKHICTMDRTIELMPTRFQLYVEPIFLITNDTPNVIKVDSNVALVMNKAVISDGAALDSVPNSANIMSARHALDTINTARDGFFLLTSMQNAISGIPTDPIALRSGQLLITPKIYTATSGRSGLGITNPTVVDPSATRVRRSLLTPLDTRINIDNPSINSRRLTLPKA
ncbi:hypothetical protein [Methanopyrus sp.]